jgi:hypothetical protein
VTNELETPTSAASRSSFKKNQAKAKRIIFYSAKDSIMIVLDTTPTLRGRVNQCVDTYTNFSYFSQQSFTASSYTQHLLIINAS